jgi:nucleoside-diphosphate-sugar epimerase
MDEVHSLPRPNNRYALTKWLGEQLVEYEARTSGLRAVILRPCMVYDEHETEGEHRSAMVRFVSNLARGRPIEVHRGSVRSWLHISDAVRAIEAAARVDEYSVINIGHPEVVGMSDLAEMIRVELNASPELVVTTELPPRMTLVKRPTLDRQRSLLRFEPLVSIADGVRRVCARYARVAPTEVRPLRLAAEL